MNEKNGWQTAKLWKSAKAKVESKQDYVKRKVRNYRDGMIKQAMSALGILRSKKGMQLIRQISRDEKSRYRDHAIFVLRHVQR